MTENSRQHTFHTEHVGDDTIHQIVGEESLVLVVSKGEVGARRLAQRARDAPSHAQPAPGKFLHLLRGVDYHAACTRVGWTCRVIDRHATVRCGQKTLGGVVCIDEESRSGQAKLREQTESSQMNQPRQPKQCHLRLPLHARCEPSSAIRSVFLCWRQTPFKTSRTADGGVADRDAYPSRLHFEKERGAPFCAGLGIRGRYGRVVRGMLVDDLSSQGGAESMMLGSISREQGLLQRPWSQASCTGPSVINCVMAQPCASLLTLERMNP